MNYICPVCAFIQMPYPAVPYNICPCCGTEFGVDDRMQSIQEIRRAWINRGMPWFDNITSPDPRWSPTWQLILGDHGAELIAPIGFVTTSNNNVVTFRSEPSLTPIGVAA